MAGILLLQECTKEEILGAELLDIHKLFGDDIDLVEISPVDSQELSEFCTRTKSVIGVYFKQNRRIPKPDAKLLRMLPFIYHSYDAKTGRSVHQLTSITYVSIDLRDRMLEVSAA